MPFLTSICQVIAFGSTWPARKSAFARIAETRKLLAFDEVQRIWHGMLAAGMSAHRIHAAVANIFFSRYFII